MPKKRPKVSIVVPVFNTEKYLSSCLQSILNQTLDDIEIIIVNDGSTDRSMEIIDKFAAEFPRKIIAITKHNGGQGEARNEGIRVATGEYIGFVDSDDWIDPEMFEQLYRIAEQGHDLVICDFYKTSGETGKHQMCKGFNGRNLNQEEIVMNSCDHAFAWNKLFKRSLLDQVEFPSIWYEDLATIPIVMSYAQNPAYLELPLYFYRQHSTSTTHSNDPKLLGVLSAWDRLLEYMNPAYKSEAVFSVAKSINIFINFKPIFANHFRAYARNHREIIESNVYYQQALRTNEIRDFYRTSRRSGLMKTRKNQKHRRITKRRRIKPKPRGHLKYTLNKKNNARRYPGRKKITTKMKWKKRRPLSNLRKL